ncbi:hypothetical protein EYF80_041124 [Liparis tanakae]|uniref:Uncharacterized protein n=1 Tax=Liparis tanakae TaxID=230148 RepID=A0A4Z2G505_9TELE|nr:hypothetical protein EYF80_041124 [Liparis tanakae]
MEGAEESQRGGSIKVNTADKAWEEVKGVEGIREEALCKTPGERSRDGVKLPLFLQEEEEEEEEEGAMER